MAVGERFKKFDLTKLRTYERYDDNSSSTVQTQSSATHFTPTNIPQNNHLVKNILSEMQISLLEKVENIPVWFEYSKEKQYELVENFFDNKIQNYPEYTFTEEDKKSTVEELFGIVSGFGKIDYLLKQDNISMVIVNGYNILIEISGKILNADIKLNEKQLTFLLKNILHNANEKNESTKNIIHCKIDNYIISVIMKPLSSKGISITIKKQPKKLGYAELIKNKFLPKDVADFLLNIVQGRKNIIITGPQGSGKTFLIDNIMTASLTNNRTSIIEDFIQLRTDADKFAKFTTGSILDEKSEDFYNLLIAIAQTYPEYFVFDIKSNKNLACVLDYAISTTGNIITLPAINAENAITKAIGLLQTCGYPEKLAKQAILKGIDYIITTEKTSDGQYRISSVTEVSLGKTNTQNLKDIYNINNNIIIQEEKIKNPVEDYSLRARFTQI